MNSWLSAAWRIVSRVCQGVRGFLKPARTRVLKVAASALIASVRYRPGFYPGELTLFSPVGREPGLPPLREIWSKHAFAVSIVDRRYSLDGVLRDQRRVHRRMLDALSSRVRRENSSA